MVLLKVTFFCEIMVAVGKIVTTSLYGPLHFEGVMPPKKAVHNYLTPQKEYFQHLPKVVPIIRTLKLCFFIIVN